MIEKYLNELGLTESQIESLSALHRVFLEQVATDVNTKPEDSLHASGMIGNRPSLSGEYQVGYGMDENEWFPEKTVSDEVAERAKDAQMGYRKGVWNGAGRTVLGRSNALSPQNVCADTASST